MKFILQNNHITMLIVLVFMCAVTEEILSEESVHSVSILLDYPGAIDVSSDTIVRGHVYLLSDSRNVYVQSVVGASRLPEVRIELNSEHIDSLSEEVTVGFMPYIVSIESREISEHVSLRGSIRLSKNDLLAADQLSVPVTLEDMRRVTVVTTDEALSYVGSDRRHEIRVSMYLPGDDTLYAGYTYRLPPSEWVFDFPTGVRVDFAAKYYNGRRHVITLADPVVIGDEDVSLVLPWNPSPAVRLYPRLLGEPHVFDPKKHSVRALIGPMVQEGQKTFYSVPVSSAEGEHDELWISSDTFMAYWPTQMQWRDPKFMHHDVNGYCFYGLIFARRSHELETYVLSFHPGTILEAQQQKIGMRIGDLLSRDDPFYQHEEMVLDFMGRTVVP